MRDLPRDCGRLKQYMIPNLCNRMWTRYRFVNRLCRWRSPRGWRWKFNIAFEAVDGQRVGVKQWDQHEDAEHHGLEGERDDGGPAAARIPASSRCESAVFKHRSSLADQEECTPY